MTGRGSLPDGLFVRHAEVELHQDAAFLGLLFLLRPGPDPERQATVLTPRLGPQDSLPPDGAVIPLWGDETQAWECDVPTLAEMRGLLDEAVVLLVALVKHSLGEWQVVCRQLPGDVVTEARASLNAALGEAMN